MEELVKNVIFRDDVPSGASRRLKKLEVLLIALKSYIHINEIVYLKGLNHSN
jgi:hypothetical protein